MRVIVPAVPAMLNPAVVPAILRAGSAPQVFDVSAHDRAYWSVLADAWADLAGGNHGALCVVEHDVEVGPGQLADLEACPRPWCAYSYWVFGGDLMEVYPGSAGLGCVKFSAALAIDRPRLFVDDVPRYNMDAHPELGGAHHRCLDAAVCHWLRTYGHQVHRHYPDVIHHHRYDYAGAYLPPAQRAALPNGHPLKMAPTQ